MVTVSAATDRTVRPSAPSARPVRPQPRVPFAPRGGPISAKIFVGNLAFSTTQDELRSLFASAGAVVDVFLPSDRETGRPRGFAFVEFATEAEAKEAIGRFDKHELGGRQLTVNAAEERGARPGGGGGAPRRFSPPGRSAPSFDAPPPPRGRPAKAKGSRRGLRGKVRSLN